MVTEFKATGEEVIKHRFWEERVIGSWADCSLVMSYMTRISGSCVTSLVTRGHLLHMASMS